MWYGVREVRYTKEIRIIIIENAKREEREYLTCKETLQWLV